MEGKNRKGSPDTETHCPLVIIAGPTAVGKTAVSVGVAEKLQGEIISADSIQVYRGLDIGSAKVTQEEMGGVPHHLIDVIGPEERYDVERFQGMARQAAEEIHSRGHIPVLVGGTGFYIQALLYGIDFTQENPEESSGIREQLEAEAREPGGAERLYQRLREVDPLSTEKIHAHNLRRVIRALEFFALHGSPISMHNAEERQKPALYDAMFFVLTDQRERLYERIDRRVDRMLEQGLLQEVEWLRSLDPAPDWTSAQGIGYKELLGALRGECSVEEAAELIRKHSRNYAKRQLTWFRREKNVIWVDISEFNYEKEKIVQWITTECMKHWG